MKTAVRAMIRHDGEIWCAVLGEPLSGKVEGGGDLSSDAVVLEILPDARTIRTHGSSKWHDVAQVHQVYEVDWVDGERFVRIILKSEVESEIVLREGEGWILLVNNALPRRPMARVLVFARGVARAGL